MLKTRNETTALYSDYETPCAMPAELNEEQLENVNGGSIGFAMATVMALSAIAIYQYQKRKYRR